MAQFGKYFEYNGHSSQEFNLMLASFDEVDEYATGMEREVQRGDMNRYRFKPNHMGMTYNSPLEFEVTFIKDMCNGSDLEFTRSEYRRIVDWLTEPEYPSLYHMTDYEEDWADEEEDYFGVFSNIQNHAYGEVIGITATFTCDSPFAWSPERTVLFRNTNTTIDLEYGDLGPYINHIDEEYEFSDEVTQIINVDADVEYTHPIIRIMPNDTNEMSISNITDGRSLILTPESQNDLITIDCQLYTITDYIRRNIYLTDIGISDPSSVYWPRLLKGENEIEIIGNVNILFTYREARKVGAY